MATSVDICNLALAMLGDEASITAINPPDGSDQAGHCSRWYPMALRKLAEEFDWSFAIRRIRLSKLKDIDDELYGFKYAYAYPADCVRVIRLSEINRTENYWYCREQNRPSEKFLEYRVEFNPNDDAKMIVTDVDNAMLKYISITDVPELFPQYFIDALVILLAAYLVGPIKRADSASAMTQNLLQQYEMALSRAKSLDASHSQFGANERIPSNIKARWV